MCRISECPRIIVGLFGEWVLNNILSLAVCLFLKVKKAIDNELCFSEWELKLVSVYIILFEIDISYQCYWECQAGRTDLSTDNSVEGSIRLIWRAQYRFSRKRELNRLKCLVKEVAPTKNIGLEQDDILGHGLPVLGPLNTR